MAVTLPLFVLILLGIIEFGRGMMVGETLTTAARNGARRATLDGSTNADIEDSVRSFCSSTLHVAPEAIAITITIDTAPGNDPAGNQLENAHRGDLCTVDIQVPFGEVALFTPKYLASQSLTASCAMEHE
jgi:Flp pilus assembly protein TadG